MATRSEQYADALIQHQVRLIRAEQGILGQVLPQLTDDLELDLVTLAVRSKVTDPKQLAARLKRAREVATPQAEKLVHKATAKATRVLADEALDLIQVDQQMVARITAQRLQAPLNPLPRGQLKRIIETHPVEGNAIHELLQKWEADEVDKFRRSMVQGAVLGENQGQLVNRVQGELGGAGGVVDTLSRKQVRALTRTSTQTYLNKARHEQLLRSEAVEAIQFSTTFDQKVCRQCAAFAGGVFDKETLEPLKVSRVQVALPQLPPLHPQCRCTIVALLVGEEPMADLDFEAWLQTQNEEVQAEVLGANIARLWREGKVSLVDIIDQTGNAMPVKDVLQDVS